MTVVQNLSQLHILRCIPTARPNMLRYITDVPMMAGFNTCRAVATERSSFWFDVDVGVNSALELSGMLVEFSRLLDRPLIQSSNLREMKRDSATKASTRRGASVLCMSSLLRGLRFSEDAARVRETGVEPPAGSIPFECGEYMTNY